MVSLSLDGTRAMSSLASNIARIVASGRSLWWLAGAITAGVAVPVAVGIVALR
jgi:hypothetical protein